MLFHFLVVEVLAIQPAELQHGVWGMLMLYQGNGCIKHPKNSTVEPRYNEVPWDQEMGYSL